jgi:hypothetical protein
MMSFRDCPDRSAPDNSRSPEKTCRPDESPEIPLKTGISLSYQPARRCFMSDNGNLHCKEDTWWDNLNIALKVLMVLGGIILATGLLFLFGFIVMHLWNWLMPELFGLKTVTYWQAWGLLVLSCILFKGMGGSGRPGRGGKKVRKEIRQAIGEEIRQEIRSEIRRSMNEGANP